MANRFNVRVGPARTPPKRTFDQLLVAARYGAGDNAAAVELGLLALDVRREEDALPVLIEIADRAPRDATLFHTLGLVHRALGDLAPAIDAFDRALALTPNARKLVHARARAAFEAGLSSLDWYDRARRLAPTDGDIILDQAAALLAERGSGPADDLLAEMLGVHPGWLPGHAALIRLRHATRRADFLAAIDAALATAPVDPRLHDMKIKALHRAGDGDGTLSAISAAHAVLGETPRLLAATASITTELGLLDRADAAFARLDPLSEEDLAIHWMRHLLRRKQPDELIALMSRMSPQLAIHAWPYLSLAWRLLGSPRAAWLERDEFVRIVDFGPDWSLLAELETTIRALHLTHGQPLDQSVRGGTQTDGHLFLRLDPAIQELRARIDAEVRAYVRALPPKDPTHPLLELRPSRPRFIGSWSVRLAGGGYHDPHVHSLGWLSSAFYVALPPAGPTANAGWLSLGEPQASLGLDLEPPRMIEPRPGRLVLFPSTTWHATKAFDAGERLTIAFDVG